MSGLLPSRGMRWLLLVLAGLAAIALFLLATASANTELFARRYDLLLLLNGAMVVLLMGLVGYQLWRLRRNLKAGVFGSRLAVRLVLRVGRHQAPRTEVARERLSQLRQMWALLVAGSGAGFAGLAFVLTSIQHWFANPERNAALVLVPIGLTSILIGAALLLATTAIYILGRNRMRRTAEGFSSVPHRGSAGL